MPAESQRQQKFFGIVDAIQKGEMPPSKAHGKAREVAKNMSHSDVHDFASTKRKGLPKHAGLNCQSMLRLASALG